MGRDPLKRGKAGSDDWVCSSRSILADGRHCLLMRCAKLGEFWRRVLGASGRDEHKAEAELVHGITDVKPLSFH
jgi:hypothetical protein